MKIMSLNKLFKFYFLPISICIAYSIELTAQTNAPSGVTAPQTISSGIAPVPSAYQSNAKINYVRTSTPQRPLTNPNDVLSATSVAEVQQSTEYFDGLGRTIQTVKKGISPAGKDLVTPVIYDEEGREAYQYLPYVSPVSNGAFKTNAFSEQATFMQAQYPGEQVYYNRTEFDASPLNRTIKAFSAGNSWAKEGGNRPVETQYLTNSTADAVRIWDFPVSGLIPTSATNRVYAAGQLFKNVTKDENGFRTIEFKDKDEKVVLKRTELAANTADGHNGWLNTYFVYDDPGRLRCVITPRAVELIKSTWVINANAANELCIFYRYDAQNRVVMSKKPGADSVETVYDVRNRPVFIRDGNLRNTGTKWLVTFYDALNRPIMTAFYASSSTREALQTSMNTAVSNTQGISYSVPEKADLVFDTHDGRSRYVARNSILFQEPFEVTAGEVEAEIDNTATQGTLNILVTNPLPNISAAALTPLAYKFYDNYNFTGAQAVQSADFAKPVAFDDTQNGTTPYPEALTASSIIPQNQTTGEMVRILGTDQWITTTSYYNDKGRNIQTISDNIGGGQNVVTSLYDFNGKLLSTYSRHKNLRSGSTPQTTLLTMMVYDHAGNLKAVRKRLNDNTSIPDKIINVSKYTELGALLTKNLSVNGSSQLESLNYEYNIRGWLRSINKAFLGTSGSTANWYGQELNYDYGYSVNQFTKNIAGTKWKSRGDNVPRSYGFAYDGTGRLTLADFNQQNTANAAWTKDKIDFTSSGITYDENGNLLTMIQKGMNGTAIQTIDNLKYGYLTGSNRLSFITDKSNNPQSTLGDFKEINNNETPDYSYDNNGNITKDLNKNITAITYNHLNLPETITIAGKGYIVFLYDALGNKRRKIVTDNTGTQVRTITTDYMNGMVYQNDTLQYITHEEGRIRPVFKSTAPVQYVYDYFVKDHLGNIRLVLTEQTDFSMYAASMETERAVIETATFSNTEETRSPKPAGYPQAKSTTKNEFVAKLNAKEGGKKIGPSIILRVMAGDTVRIGAEAFYKSEGPAEKKQTTPEDMLASLLQAFGGDGTAENMHNAANTAVTSPFANVNSSAYGRLKEKTPDQNRLDRPKAYLNFVLFDDQFNLVENNSGVRQVNGNADELQTLTVGEMPIQKTGFLYVYTSNETAQDVFFDNVTVQEISGPLLEESHYYPFGLTMAGISNRTIGKLANRKLYAGNELQTEEFADGSGLELYDFNARTYDHQTGRFIQIDPLGDKGNQEGLSPYHYSYNNPALYSDPDGKLGLLGAAIGGLIGGVSSLVKSVIQNGVGTLKDGKTWQKAGVNALGGAIVGATGGLAAGVIATGATAYAGSLAEDAIDGNELNHLKAIASAGVGMAFVGLGSMATSSISKAVGKNYWNRGNTNGFIRYLERNTATRVGYLVNRTTDVAAVGAGIGLDNLLPSNAIQKPLIITLPTITVTAKRSGDYVHVESEETARALANWQSIIIVNTGNEKK